MPREGLLDTGRLMLPQDAVAFGTWAMAAHGLDNIEREQWRFVWPRIRGFTFEAEPEVGTDGDTTWIAAGWRSEATGPDGRPFIRLGRATFILARRDSRWLCVHSHISLQPTQSESAHDKLRAEARNSFVIFSVSLPAGASPRLGKRANRPPAPQKTITPRPTASESRSSYARLMSARP